MGWGGPQRQRGQRRLKMSDVIDLSMAERRMRGAVESVKSNFATIRTGRANPTLLDRVEVEAYGTTMPLRSVANVGAPEPRLLTVTPFDPNTLKNIERAIRDSDIGLNPQNDGKIIRLPIPELTEERRRELIRVARHMAEEELQRLTNEYVKRIDAALGDKEAELMEV